MIWNLFLMLVWAAMTNDFRPQNLGAGFGLGYLVLALLVARKVTKTSYPMRVVRTVSFALFYVRELVLANLRMARDVCRIRPTYRPAIVAIPLEIETDSEAELTLLANLISLTPGTLSLDLSPDRRTLYVHTMEIPNGDVEAFRRTLKHDFERRVLEVLH